MKKNLLFSLAGIAFALLLPGCGYQIGMLGHPQLNSIGVAPVSNDTLFYNVAAQVRGQLCESFMTDGTLKLVDEKKADCIIYARVSGVQISAMTWSTYTEDADLNPNQWKVSITIDYSVILPGRLTPLTSGSVSGDCEFTSGADMEVSRTQALRQAAHIAADTVVARVTEAW